MDLSIFKDYTIQIVAIGSAILGVISGIMGSFAFIRKQSLLGDAVSHSALPGICIAFILTQIKATEALLLGATLSGFLASYFIFSIVRYSKIKFDTALAVVFSSFFGLGVVFLTYIQKLANSNQAGLDKFIFGQASTFLARDLKMMVAMCIITIVLVGLFWKEMKIVSFDSEFSDTIGISSQKVGMLISFLIVLAVMVGIQMVGVVLMSAMLIAPASAARQWTNQLSKMIVLSSIFGAISGVVGTVISSTTSKLATGPVIVLVASVIVLISLIFAPKRGLLWRKLKFRNKNKEEYKVIE
ncbi:MAG: iron chelate uptake ABC transporter family permease subunit [Andreesenia angusta]|nr:iron chelate uptake ABC transporter family permease subunit [Andreesenia angusta]